MFCSKCGKQIDDDSKFCPFCGNTIEKSPAQKGTADMTSDMQGGKQDMGAGRKRKKSFPAKLIACGAAAAVVLVAVCVFLFRSSGGGVIEKSFLGKMFSLSWDEISDMTARDFRNLLNEEDILYEYSEDSYSEMWALSTEGTSGFMGSDSVYVVGSNDFSAYIQQFIMFYETREDCRDGYEDMKGYLEKNLAENTMAVDMMMYSAVDDHDWTDVWMGYSNFHITDAYSSGQKKGGTFCLMEECAETEDIDKYLDILAQHYGEDILEREAVKEVQEKPGEYAVYKAVCLSYGTTDDMADVLEFYSVENNSYSNDICIAEIKYLLAKKSEYISKFAALGWDSIAGKEINTEKFEESLDNGFRIAIEPMLDKKAGWNAEDFDGNKFEAREFTDKEYYSIMYMLEKHNFDAYTGQYIDSKDKNFWYITNFEYDMDKKEAVDLSDYMDSARVYCAVEYNYNVDEYSYFESDFDKALFLVNRGYNSETGGRFEGNEEKRLWFMKNYGYDIVAEKEVDKAVAEALLAYQDYMDTNNIKECLLIYLDDNEIPELIVCRETGEWDLVYYNNNKIVESETSIGYSIAFVEGGYIERSGNIFVVQGGAGGYLEYYFYHLSDEGLEKIGNCGFQSHWEDDYITYYWINDEAVSENEYDEYLTSLFVGVQKSLSVYYGDVKTYTNVLSAFDDLRTVIYYLNMPEIGEFELSNGVLTVSTNDGSRYGWKSSTPFSFSYPVADDCVWEQGWYESNFVKDRDISYEELKATITSEFERYESIYQESGAEWFTEYGIESPLSIQITVKDGVVVQVRVSGS